MSKIPRWLRIVLIVFVVLIVIALVVPYFLDVDRYRGTIITTIEKETGRKAEIGKIRARLIPSVGFVIEGFKLSNPPNFAKGNLMEVEAIRGSLAWWPLLSGTFQLSGIELVNPKIVLLEGSRGRTNYDFGDWEKKGQAKPAAEEAPAFRIADIDSIELTGVDVTVGRVTGQRIVPSIRATNISADLGNVALDRKRVKQWEADANLKGVQIQLAALKEPLEFTSGSFTLDEGKIDSKFGLALGKAVEASGTLKVADVEDAVAEFDLSTSLLDLGQLGASGAETAPASAPATGKSSLVAKGKVRAQRIRFAPYEATQGSAEIRVFTDRIEVWPVSMQLYGGTVGATARVDLRQVPERFSSNIEVQQLNVEQLTAASGAGQKVTGTAELTLQAFGSLGNNLMNSLTGTGNMAVRNGTLPGFDMGSLQTLAKVQKVLTFGAGTAEKFSGATAFSSITADLALGGGRVNSQRIHVDSPSGTIDMRGSMGLVDQTLNYDGNAVMMGGQTGTGGDNPIGAITGILGQVTKQTVGRVSIPFAVRGTLEKPRIQPGRGIPTFSTASQSGTQTQTQTQEPAKKKSILDLFRKPPSE